MYQNLTSKRQQWRNKIKRLIGNSKKCAGPLYNLAIWIEGTLIIRLDNENSTIKGPIIMVPITTGWHRIVARQGAIIVAGVQVFYRLAHSPTNSSINAGRQGAERWRQWRCQKGQKECRKEIAMLSEEEKGSIKECRNDCLNSKAKLIQIVDRTSD